MYVHDGSMRHAYWNTIISLRLQESRSIPDVVMQWHEIQDLQHYSKPWTMLVDLPGPRATHGLYCQQVTAGKMTPRYDLWIILREALGEKNAYT